jgi:hypothetical protein
MRVTVIGGSNTVMKPGYITDLPEAARSLGLKLDIVANLAVGNTTSLAGLMQLKGADVLAESDLLLIEYALNDASAYGEQRKNIESWTRAYEGIIRHALTVNPRIRILSVILAPKLGPHRNSIPSVYAGIYYLSEWYGVDKIDINRELTLRFGAGFHDLKGVYGDAAHYERPIFTRLVAEMIAGAMRNIATRTSAAMVLPPPVDPANACDSSYAIASGWAGLKRVSYRNSRYVIHSADLAGGDATLTLEGGRLLSAQFVCVPDVARLYVTADGTVYEVPTLRPGVRDGKYRFLASMLSFEQIPKASDGMYRLSVNRPVQREPVLVRQNGASQYRGDPETILPLVSVLHTGTLTDVSVREFRPVERSSAGREKQRDAHDLAEGPHAAA